MAISRQKKEEIVEKVADIVKDSESVVFVNFHGLSVADANEMRRDFKRAGIGYTVAKKALVRRALESASVQGDAPPLDGELALAYLPAEAQADESADVTLPARKVAAFQKKFKNAVQPQGGILEMRYVAAEGMRRLASIPPREVLYGRLAVVMNAPIQGTVSALSGVARSFVSVLDQVAKAKS